MKLSRDDDTFLVIRTNRAEMGRIRRTIHHEDFGYTGDDAVLTPGQNKDYMGLPVRMMTDMLEAYWDDWKAATKQMRVDREGRDAPKCRVSEQLERFAKDDEQFRRLVDSQRVLTAIEPTVGAGAYEFNHELAIELLVALGYQVTKEKET